MKQKDGNLIYPNPPPLSPLSTFSNPNDGDYYNQSESSPSPASSFNSISPILLLVIVILAVIFFISGLLHLLIRFLLKRSSSPSIFQSNRYPEVSGSHTLQRQLQQLFRLHDSGLDQSFIDALPLFHYKNILGLKEPFDCAVCLCEFSEHDRLRLLPKCSHAFHVNCIDTWLLSNSTCPLCRSTLLGSSLRFENPRFDFNEISGPENGCSCSLTHRENVISVRLGKFKKLNGEKEEEEEGGGGGGESSHKLEARRCYSMGAYQYVVGNSDLQVSSLNKNGEELSNELNPMKEKMNPENFPGNMEMEEGKKISGRSKGESFSVSKIWLWSKKSRFPIQSSSNTHVGVATYLNLGSHLHENPISSESEV